MPDLFCSQIPSRKKYIYLLQAQYGYVVVQMLMIHLDDNNKKEPKIKASIVDVLSETVLIAAGGSIGRHIIDYLNGCTLLIIWMDAHYWLSEWMLCPKLSMMCFEISAIDKYNTPEG